MVVAFLIGKVRSVTSNDMFRYSLVMRCSCTLSGESIMVSGTFSVQKFYWFCFDVVLLENFSLSYLIGPTVTFFSWSAAFVFSYQRGFPLFIEYQYIILAESQITSLTPMVLACVHEVPWSRTPLLRRSVTQTRDLCLTTLACRSSPDSSLAKADYRSYLPTSICQLWAAIIHSCFFILRLFHGYSAYSIAIRKISGFRRSHERS